jgi:hypothetical protein
MSKTFNPEILKRWGSIGKDITQGRQPSVDWLAVKRMVCATKPLLDANREDAKRLLEQSNFYLDPFTDPIEMDFGLHRWLEGDREEAYSDWLAWIVGQLRTPERIIKLLLGEDSTTLMPKCKGELVVRRENSRNGMECTRRTDLEIIFGNQNAIVVEVKMIDAGDVDPKQLRDLVNYTPEFAHHLLLAPSGGAKTDLGKFKLLLWQDLCIRLRQIVPELSSENITAAAMTLAFVGAVEQNLLGLPRGLKNRLQQGQLVNTATLDYLKTCPRKEKQLCLKQTRAKI